MSASRDRRWTRRQLLASGAGLAAAAIPGALPKHSRGGTRDSGSGRPPNIVFILSDNHRWDAMGCMAHPFVLTPHLFGEHRHVELRWPFEEVIRVPLLMRHPRLLGEPGQHRDLMGTREAEKACATR